MLRRIMLIAAVVLAVGGVSLSSAGADHYGPCIAVVSDDTPVAGQDVTVTGSGANHDGDVSASVDGAEVGTGTADDDSEFSFSAAIPDGASGSESLTVDCGTNRGTDVLSLTIVAGSNILPETGSSDTVPMTAVALGALALGGVALGGARLRARSASKSEL